MDDEYISTDQSLRELNRFGFASFDADLNAGSVTLDLTTDVPKRADTISVFADPTGDVSAELIFFETETANTEIGRITDSQNADLGTSAGNTLVADTVVVSPFVQVEFLDDSGVANQTTGSVYIR